LPKKEKKGSKKKEEVTFDEDDEDEEVEEEKKRVEEKVEEDEEEDEDEEEEDDEEDDGGEEEDDEDEEDEDEDDREDEGEEEDDDEDEEDEEEGSKKKSKSRKKGSKLEGQDKTAALLAKIGMFCGIFAVGGLLLRIILDVLNWVIPGVWCLYCMLWPIFALGFLAALAAIGLGIAKIVMDPKGDKKIALISIALGAGYIVLGVVWAIVSVVIDHFI